MTAHTIPSLIERHSKNNIFIIAEAGTAHLGSLERALTLIDACASAGAHALKFQYIIADEIIHPDTGKVSLPSGNIDLYSRFRELERPPSFYRSLKEHCEKCGVLFLCSSFGPESTERLTEMDAAAYKLASPELNYRPLLDRIAEGGKPVFVSTGMATFSDIAMCMKRLSPPLTPDQICFLQCVTSYPAPPEEYNLLTLRTIASKTGTFAGISDHSADPFLVPGTAAVLQSFLGKPFILEKHVTLNRKGGGLDDPFSIDVRELSELTRKLPVLCHNGTQHLKEHRTEVVDIIGSLENDKRQDLRSLSSHIQNVLSTHNDTLIATILGSGVKEPSPSEREHVRTTRRSLRAIRDIKSGETITDQNARYLRSEKNCAPGIPCPDQEILGQACAARDIPDGEAITAENITIRFYPPEAD
ncbi:MAG: spore coat protein [Candidatus Lokiarchaeota archaeon]|nr:spore coat protein [Candidatus Lokiarchaeota archaeon]